MPSLPYRTTWMGVRYIADRVLLWDPRRGLGYGGGSLWLLGLPHLLFCPPQHPSPVPKQPSPCPRPCTAQWCTYSVVLAVESASVGWCRPLPALLTHTVLQMHFLVCLYHLQPAQWLLGQPKVQLGLCSEWQKISFTPGKMILNLWILIKAFLEEARQWGLRLRWQTLRHTDVKISLIEVGGLILKSLDLSSE